MGDCARLTHTIIIQISYKKVSFVPFTAMSRGSLFVISAIFYVGKPKELMAVTSSRNKRSEERVNVALPVRLGDATGLTRDVSATGISFEVDANYTLGSEINFIIEVKVLNEKMLLKCKGSIVRTEAHDQKIGVAVKITESVMEAAK